MSQPILPPRRKIPPPPPPRSTGRNNVSSGETQTKLESDFPIVKQSFTPPAHRGFNKFENPSVPPPIPPKWTRPNDNDLARLLARRPPPPPRTLSAPTTLSRSPRGTDVVLQRRLPPMPPLIPVQPLKVEDENAIPYDVYEDSQFCLECRDFSLVDAHASHFPRHTVTSLDNLAYDLTEPFSSETEKVRAIFTWLHHNVAYDAESFFSGNLQASTAESTLSSGLAVCDGYAGLFKGLVERIGIQVHKITGHGKGVGYVATGPDCPIPNYSSNHAWNSVFMDGTWHLVDSCWGAGALAGTTYQQRFTPMWFTSAPADFGRSHFPEDPSDQLISELEDGWMSWESYIMAPATPVLFIDFYKLDLSPSVIQPSTGSIVGGQRILFHLTKRCEHMSTAEANNFTFMIYFGDVKVFLELNNEGGWSGDIFIPQKTGEVTLGYVTTVGGRDAKGIGLKTVKNAVGRQSMAFGGLARWSII